MGKIYSGFVLNSNNRSQRHDKLKKISVNIRRFLYNFAIIVTMPAAKLANYQNNNNNNNNSSTIVPIKQFSLGTVEQSNSIYFRNC
jgi:hypothetical protein